MNLAPYASKELMLMLMLAVYRLQQSSLTLSLPRSLK